jgi:DNA-binding response OmpR family regulator
MYAILVADDPDELAVYATVLQRVGLAVTTATGLEQVLPTWSEHPADIVFLVLPDQPHPEQVSRVRAETLAPLIITTRQADDRLHAELLNMGADLIITPPISLKLLIAQIRALLRRGGGVPAMGLPTLLAAGLALDPANRVVDAPGKLSQRLTHLEFRLLYTLMLNRNQVIPTDTIVERVWGYTGQGDRDLVRGLVSRLRVKIEADPRNPRFIVTVPGVGYTFNVHED